MISIRYAIISIILVSTLAIAQQTLPTYSLSQTTTTQDNVANVNTFTTTANTSAPMTKSEMKAQKKQQ